MSRSKIVYIVVIGLLFISLGANAVVSSSQQRSIEQLLRAKYSEVTYHHECGGWYLLVSERDETIYYSMGDADGNVVASDAIAYRLYDGYISLRVADRQKKRLHDEWVENMKSYTLAYEKYCQINAEYDEALKAYNLKVGSAKQKAQEKYDKMVAEAQRVAQEEHKRNASNSGGLLGGVLNVIGSAVVTANATNSVNYDAILREELEKMDLLAPPSRPYNPKPECPQEPDSGFYWKNFTYMQPCPYDEVDYDAISESNMYADVKKGGKYGLVNSRLEEVIPCVSKNKVNCGWLEDNNLLVSIDGKYGVLSSKRNEMLLSYEFDEIKSTLGYFLCKQNNRWGVFSSQAKELYPCQYQDVKLARLGQDLCLLIQNKGLWGVIDFYSGTELLPCQFTNVEQMGDDGEYIKSTIEGRVGLYTSKGVLLFPCEYSDVKVVKWSDYADEVYFELSKNNTVGVYNSEGVEVIPIGKYSSYISKFPFLYVESGGLWGVCSNKGEEIVSCVYTNISHADKLFVVSLPNSMQGLVDFSGKELFPAVRFTITEVLPNYIKVSDMSGKYGALNYAGEVIVPIKNKFNAVEKKVELYAKKNDLGAENVLALEKIDMSYNAFLYRHGQLLKKQNTFSFYAQNYVERIVNEWQKKGEFEKVSEWHKRVNGETRKQKVFVLTKDAQEAYIAKCARKLPKDSVVIVGNYDADNETYRIRSRYRDEDLIVPVPSMHALEFKMNFSALRKEPSFYVEGDSIGLAEYKFYLSDEMVCKFNNEASLTYNIAQVDYNFDEILIDPTIVSASTKGKQTISTSNIAIGNSDVDIQIPTTAMKQENTFVVIIANKHYDEAPNVDYAFNDGYIFKEYCIKTLGIPSSNIRFKEDATFNNIRESVNWIRDIATNKLYKNTARFIFYYSGHGVPDELTRSMYLLPKDGVAANIANTGYKISDLYDVLAESGAESLVLLDACFSGFTKSGSALASTKGVVKITTGAPRGNTVLMSASSSNEVAHQYEEKSHGLFTYYLLKKLQESQGDITLGELFTYVEKQVVRTSLTVIRKSQTPSVAVGTDAQAWKERKL